MSDTQTTAVEIRNCDKCGKGFEPRDVKPLGYIDKVCPDCREESKRELKELEAAEHLRSIATNALIASGAPKRHIRKLDQMSDNGRSLEVGIMLYGRLRTGFLAALFGDRGTGKTQMAVRLMRGAAKAGMTIRYVTAMGFLMAIKASFKSEHETEEDVMRQFVEYDFLVIDEIGRRSESQWENNLLIELIDLRYGNDKDTLIVSAHDHDGLIESIGPSLASRMVETGGFVECDWPSYRKGEG